MQQNFRSAYSPSERDNAANVDGPLVPLFGRLQLLAFGPVWFVVVRSIAPTLCSADAEECIASNASLLNLRLVATANLHPVAISNQLIYPLSRESRIGLCQSAKTSKLIVLDVGPAFANKYSYTQ